MENIIAIGLAFFIVFTIIQFDSFIRKKSMNKTFYSQSDIHSLIKDFLPEKMPKKTRIFSQSFKHIEQHMIKIVVIDNKAYWVKDNIFYTAETKGGIVMHDTAMPVDIESMPQKELDKMLFILDNLGRRKNDDSSSSGN